MAPALDVDGLLLDIDGVLVTSWRALPGALEAVAALRAHAVPFRLLTNTTTHTRVGLAETLAGAGFDFESSEIVTAVTATASHLRAQHEGAKVFVLSDGDPTADLDRCRALDVDDADVVVIGGASDAFGYDSLNRAFRRLSEGASLVAMHRNMYWRTADGLQLDAGAFVAGLEAARTSRRWCAGSRRRRTSASALGELGVEPSRAGMVGDDVVNDVGGAQAAGLTGVLVRTGKFRPGRPRARRGRRRRGLDRRRARPAGHRGLSVDLGSRRRARGCSRASRRSTPGRAPCCRSARTRAGAVSWSSKLGAVPGSLVLDVAAGTGLVSRELAARRRVRVVAVDPSEPMLRAGLPANEAAGLDALIDPVLGRAEALPFADGTFDALTFTYLVRYVDDPAATLRELARVVRPGGSIASLEFHVPQQPLVRAGWYAYTRGVLPVWVRSSRRSGGDTGRFLGPSIDRLEERAPLPEQVRWWQEAGIRHVRSRELTLGAAVVMWGVKGGRRARA